jgi:hypothetical protein
MRKLNLHGMLVGIFKIKCSHIAIWAMQWDLNPPKVVLDAPGINLMGREHASRIHIDLQQLLKLSRMCINTNIVVAPILNEVFFL